uniref:Uncharacterized protein n=1 Tax=Utricularia reniformis TaxID=192314 RepID=A0A1Y0B0J7_9LAMI|nr:hypothetical protein AEK19_MT0670 [Utricularia reniformis]ART30920.1 hypothetical protein AEK19_MT0670 [Utricularia reniformis]
MSHIKDFYWYTNLVYLVRVAPILLTTGMLLVNKAQTKTMQLVCEYYILYGMLAILVLDNLTQGIPNVIV